MAKLMHSSIRFVVLAFCVACFSTELVAQSSYRLKWSDNGERCLFKAKDNFYLIDVEKREKEILFENGFFVNFSGLVQNRRAFATFYR